MSIGKHSIMNGGRRFRVTGFLNGIKNCETVLCSNEQVTESIALIEIWARGEAADSAQITELQPDHTMTTEENALNAARTMKPTISLSKSSPDDINCAVAEVPVTPRKAASGKGRERKA